MVEATDILRSSRSPGSGKPERGELYLGIDVGSVSVAVVLIEKTGGIVQSDYRRHHGEPEEILKEILQTFPLNKIRSYALTGSGAERLELQAKRLDDSVAQLEAVRFLFPDARNILSVGGGSFSLTELDEKGRFLRNVTNSACASGTGAFLDQQALRLGIAPERLGSVAAEHHGVAPPVATRCAVFAKTDMIHLQQEGFTVEAVARGLCYGLGSSTVEGLLGGRRIRGKTVIVGGVARNECVVEQIRRKLGVETVVPERPELVGALGAALWARTHGEPVILDPSSIGARKRGTEGAALRPPLALRLSEYPEPKYVDWWIDDAGTEAAVLVEPPRGGALRVALGVDIGSTSTKAVLTEPSGRTVAWAYRKTAGDPLRATQLVFQAFLDMERRHGVRFEVIGAGTTGSGRKMVGAVIGADLVLNEITAHAKAAVHLDPEVDTIIELGGQDAKFTQLAGGVVYNSVMNYVCAAGTGSFIEEQAQKLEIPLDKFAEAAMGVTAPVTSDRCTVYMERDLQRLLAMGWSKAQVAAAVLHSVRDNYLNKVVGGLRIGRKVVFQGATARNKALVAAFEQRLGVPIKVSPLCHVTGALGMALLVLERVEGPTSFRGLRFARERISVENEVCGLCHNHCRLSLIRVGSQTVAWGLKCGREYEDRKPRVKDAGGYRFLQAREAALLGRPQGGKRSGRFRIGIPRALTTYGYLPLWRTFFESLGCEVVLSPPTSGDTLSKGEELVSTELCAPILAALGHAAQQVEGDVDFVFFPHTIRERCPAGYTNAYFCCYVQACPSILRNLEELKDLCSRKLLAPVVDYTDFRVLAEGVHRELGPKLGFSLRRIRKAVGEGVQALVRFQEEAFSLGRKALAEIRDRGDFGIVLIGRPYNTLDRGMNLDLPRKIAEMGHVVLFMDMLEVSPNRVADRYPNMYWQYGQRILSTADYVGGRWDLFPVYFTSFSCGPDSYVLTYFKEIMARYGKPYLVLQFDGHGADAGYLTRIEAALESFRTYFERKARRRLAAG